MILWVMCPVPAGGSREIKNMHFSFSGGDCGDK